MRKLMAWYATLGLFAVLVAACGIDKVAQKEEYLIGDVPAEKYYQQFLYKKDESEALPYRYLSLSLTKLKAISATENLYFSSSLYLHADGKYVLDYEEAQGTASGSMTTTKPVFRKRIEGKWTVDRTSLVLNQMSIGQVGIGAGVTFNDQETVALSLTSPIHSAEAKGKSVVFYYTQSNKGMPETFE